MKSSRFRKQASIFFSILVLLTVQASVGSASSTDHALWEKVIGERAYLEECYSVEPTDDGGYILAGRRSLAAGGAKSNVFFVKADGNGNVQWSSEIDPYPSYNSHSRVLSVVQANAGGYVAAGWVESPDYGDEGYLIKIDSAGRLLWHYIYGNVSIGSGGEDDVFKSVSKTSDGGYIVAGTTEALAQRGWTDAWLVKVNAAGSIEWSKVYGGNSLEYAYEIIQTTDGGYVFAGSTDSFGDETRVYVQKTGSDGTQQWLNVFDFNGSSDSGDQQGLSVQQTADLGYVVAGSYEEGADPGISFLLKLDAAGNKQWVRSYNLGSGSEILSSLARSGDGGYLAVGRTNSVGSGSYDALVMKIEALGTVKWSETYGGGDYDAAYAIRKNRGGYIIGGKTVGQQWAGGTDMYLIRIREEILPTSTLYLPLVLK